MKGVWKFSLSLTLGLLTGAAWADEIQWRSAAARPTVPPAAQTQPTTDTTAKPVARTPAITLDKPVKVATQPAKPVVDPNLQPVSLSTPTASEKPTVRGQNAEPPKAMPVGPPTLTEEPLKMPGKVVVEKQPEYPAGTVVLPAGTFLPPGAVLPPNVVIAQAPLPGQGPMMPHDPMMPQGPMLTGPVYQDAVSGMPIGPVETLGGPQGVPVEGSVGYPEITCGDPGVCCVTAESCYDGCCEEGCQADGCFGGGKRFWIKGDYLMWWFKGAPAPPLLTTGTTGILGQNGTAIVIGNQNHGEQAVGGGRVELGYWFTEDQSIGIGGSVLFVPGGNQSEFRGSGGVPQLFRPFTAFLNGGDDLIPASEIVSMRNSIAGSFKMETDTYLYGGDINAVCRLKCDSWYRVEALGGFRYLGMGDELILSEKGTALEDQTFRNGDITFQQGSSFRVTDSFSASNNFFGGQLGIGAQFKLGKKCFLDLKTKAALGVVVQSVEVDGFTITPQGQRLGGGLLAQTSNIGKDHRSRFAVVPEGTVNLGCNVTDWCRVHVGYTFLYLSSAVRSVDQIDSRVNSTRLPGSSAPYLANQPPKVPFKTTDFWAQGLNFGMEFRW